MTHHYDDRPEKPLFPSMQHTVQEVIDEKTEVLQNRVEELENALRFYGNVENYETLISRVEADRGERARIVLYGREEQDWNVVP